MSDFKFPWKTYYSLAAIGGNFALCILAGVWLGNQADIRLGIGPFGLIIGVLVGSVLGLYGMFKIVNKLLKNGV